MHLIAGLAGCYLYWERVSTSEGKNLYHSLVVDPELTKLCPETYPAAVEMHMKGGKKLEVVVRYLRGHPKSRLTDEQVQAKFRKLASPLRNGRRVQEVVDLVMDVEETDDSGALMEALVL